MVSSEVWTNTVGSGSNARIHLEYDSIANNSTHAWLVNPRVVWEQNSGWSDSVNYIDAGGSAVDVVRVQHNTALNGNRTWNVAGTAVALSYGATTGVTFAVVVYGVSFFRGDSNTSTFTWNITLPQRPYSPPLPATNFTATYVDVNKANLSWTANYTGSDGARPWRYQYIERRETESWADALNVSGRLSWSPTNWQDTTLQNNKKYVYRHIAQGPGGWSPYTANTAPIYTKPNAPSAVVAQKQMNNDILVTATNAAPHATKWEFSDSANGTTGWTVLTSTHTSAVYTHSAPNQAVPHYYRVRAQTPDGKWSDYSVVSNGVQLQAPPNPPTWGQLDAAYDATDAIDTSFVHNSIDTTAQTAYEMQWRSSVDGVTWSAWTLTGKVTSTTSSRTWAASAFPQNRYIELQVRTWGTHAAASAWSATATFRTSARPVAGIAAPTADQVLAAKTGTVTWTYADSEGSAQSAWRVTLKTGLGTDLETWTGSGPQLSYTMPYVLADDTSYQVLVAVRDGVNLWSTDVGRAFSVSYLPPTVPTCTVSWDIAKGAGVLDIFNPSPAGSEPEAVSNNIYRDGILIAENVPLNTAFVDPLPLTTGGSTYVIEAISVLPSSALSADVSLPFEAEVHRRFWINAGPGWGTVASFYGNVSRSRRTGVLREVESYSGREYGVETIGEGRIDELSFSTTVIQAEDSPAEFHAVVGTPTTLCFREPSGRYFVSPEPAGESTTQDITAVISLSFKRVDYREGVL